MRTLTTTARINSDHTLSARVPDDIGPGTCRIVIVLDDPSGGPGQSATLSLPQPHPVGPSDPECTYRREDLYDDDGG
jgi:hypothetical protein